MLTSKIQILARNAPRDRDSASRLLQLFLALPTPVLSDTLTYLVPNVDHKP